MKDLLVFFKAVRRCLSKRRRTSKEQPVRRTILDLPGEIRNKIYLATLPPTIHIDYSIMTDDMISRPSALGLQRPPGSELGALRLTRRLFYDDLRDFKSPVISHTFPSCHEFRYYMSRLSLPYRKTINSFTLSNVEFSPLYDNEDSDREEWGRAIDQICGEIWPNFPDCPFDQRPATVARDNQLFSFTAVHYWETMIGRWYEEGTLTGVRFRLYDKQPWEFGPPDTRWKLEMTFEVSGALSDEERKAERVVKPLKM